MPQLSGARQDPTAAANILAAYLRDGTLMARAKAIWRSEERFTSQAWKSAPEGVTGGPIPTAHWRFEKNLAEDRAQWRWPASRFTVTTRLKPRLRIMMRGVKFDLGMLMKLQPAGTSPDRGNCQDGSGAPTPSRLKLWKRYGK